MSIINSISRGFGFSIGRRMADNVMDNMGNMGKSNGVYKESPSLTGGQIFKTIMWFIPMMLLSMTVNIIYDMFADSNFLDKSYHPNFTPILIIAVIFTYIIGRGYYNDNKKIIDSVNEYNKVQVEKERLIKETEEHYISEKITKREYEVLMKKINKL